jgi:hypothetical protein
LAKQRSLSILETPYRGFPFKEAPLAALLNFAKEKQYFESDHQLIGFYGTKTVEDYLKEPGGFRSKSKSERKAEKERRKSDLRANLPDVVEDEGEVGEDVVRPTGVRRIPKGLSKVFMRRITIA